MAKSHRYHKSIGTSGNARGEAGEDRSDRADEGLHGKASCWRVCTDTFDFNASKSLFIRPSILNISKEEKKGRMGVTGQGRRMWWKAEKYETMEFGGIGEPRFEAGSRGLQQRNQVSSLILLQRCCSYLLSCLALF